MTNSNANSTDYVDVDLEDTHGNSLISRKYTNNSRGYNVTNINPYNNNENNVIIRRELTKFEKICRKIKNAFLMLPALFILCIILFVNINTLIIGLPYKLMTSYTIPSFLLNGILGILFAISSFICLVSFIKCVFTSSYVKDNPPFNPNIECKRCNKCGSLKPERAHHCSLCNECTLKMDHHCPWYSYYLCIIIYIYDKIYQYILLSLL